MVSSFSVQDDDDLPLDVINRTSGGGREHQLPVVLAAIADRHGTRKKSNQQIKCEKKCVTNTRLIDIMLRRIGQRTQPSMKEIQSVHEAIWECSPITNTCNASMTPIPE